MRYEFLQKLMEAMIKENDAVVEELKKELKEFLTNAKEFDRQEFVYDLINAMYTWSDELRKVRRLKKALLAFMEDEFERVYEYVESRFDYMQDRVDKVYRSCRRYDD